MIVLVSNAPLGYLYYEYKNTKLSVLFYPAFYYIMFY